MKRATLLLAIVMIVVFTFAAVVQAKPGPPPDLNTLDPGGFRDIEQDLTINIVFVGYEQGAGIQDIDESAFLSELPATYRTINRYPILL